MHVCKGQCSRLPRAMRNGCGYGEMVVRCKNCELFFEYEGMHCPCCSTKLSRTPAKSKTRIKVYIE